MTDAETNGMLQNQLLDTRKELADLKTSHANNMAAEKLLARETIQRLTQERDKAWARVDGRIKSFEDETAALAQERDAAREACRAAEKLIKANSINREGGCRHCGYGGHEGHLVNCDIGNILDKFQKLNL